MQEQTLGESPLGDDKTSTDWPEKQDNNNILSRVQFEQQPPPNLRKSNFFSFVLTLYDQHNLPVQFESAVFVDFIKQEGVRYRIATTFSDGEKSEKEMNVFLVDSISKQTILYEGIAKNPEMRRVLLTHEVLCSRCNENKSCGNRNETPSDPVIERNSSNKSIKIYLKCNQNCLKQAGNPREMRRFQIGISSAHNILGYSDQMFVHNNSKHGRRTRKMSVDDGLGKLEAIPVIRAICPSEGWTSGGTNVLIIGEHFFDGLEVIFGSVIVFSELITPQVLNVQAPPRANPGTVDVILSFKNRQFCKLAPAKFFYFALNEPTIDYGFHRLSNIVPRCLGDPERLPKAIILKRAADIIDNVCPHSRGGLQGSCSYVSNQGPGIAYMPPPQSPTIASSSSYEANPAKKRIIVNGISGALPSVSSLTTSSANSLHYDMNNNHHSPTMVLSVSSNSVRGYQTMFGSGAISTGIGLPSSPSAIAGATVNTPSPALPTTPGCYSNNCAGPAVFTFSSGNLLSAVKQKSAFSSRTQEHVTSMSTSSASQGLPTMVSAGNFNSPFTIPSNPSCTQYLHSTPPGE